LFTKAVLLSSIIMAASFAYGGQPTQSGNAPATQQTQTQPTVQTGQTARPATATSQPAATQSTAGSPSQAAPKLMAQASQQLTPVSGQPLQPNLAANTNNASQTAQASNCANSGSGPCVVTGHIVYAGTGWGGEAFYMTLDTPISPACPNTGNANGAAVVPSLAQYKEMVAEAIYALSTGRRVDIWFNGCFNGVAQVVAMNIYNQ
jgi:hypothetical protein